MHCTFYIKMYVHNQCTLRKVCPPAVITWFINHFLPRNLYLSLPELVDTLVFIIFQPLVLDTSYSIVFLQFIASVRLVQSPAVFRTCRRRASHAQPRRRRQHVVGRLRPWELDTKRVRRVGDQRAMCYTN